MLIMREKAIHDKVQENRFLKIIIIFRGRWYIKQEVNVRKEMMDVVMYEIAKTVCTT